MTHEHVFQPREPKASDRLWCPFCAHRTWLSTEDPDASFGDMLGHIRTRHHREDQTPSVLWPKIEVK